MRERQERRDMGRRNEEKRGEEFASGTREQGLRRGEGKKRR